MPKFFVPMEQISETNAYIIGADATHITCVLRTKPVEKLVLCDGEGNDYICQVKKFSPDRVDLEVLCHKPCEAEPTVNIALYMALPKSDKMNYIIQKSVELGIYRIVPFFSSRCIVKLSAKDAEKKAARWQKIAYEAAKQCGRGIIPQVSEPLSFQEMIKQAVQAEMPLLFYEGERKTLLKSVLEMKKFQNASVVIGPEGGFEEKEVTCAKDAGLISVSLGKRILRCETAPGCAITAIMYQTDNL